MASYVVVRSTSGFVDETLNAWDELLGFDWHAAYSMVAARPWLGRLGGDAYSSIFYTPFVTLGALVLTGRQERADRFLRAFGIALLLGLAMFWFLPAQSALAFHEGLTPPYMPRTGIAHVPAIEALRSGALREIDPRMVVGMITFPSFHAVSAVLFAWAILPVRIVRVPMIALNAAMLIATPVEGTHYLVDVIGGVALAVVSLRLAQFRGLATISVRRMAPAMA